jgi:hypothetical protein
VSRVAVEDVGGASSSAALVDLVEYQITKRTRSPNTGTKRVSTTRRTLTTTLNTRCPEMKSLFRKRRISSQIPPPMKAIQKRNTTIVHSASLGV